jgi:hypothetical protein
MSTIVDGAAAAFETKVKTGKDHGRTRRAGRLARAAQVVRAECLLWRVLGPIEH